MNCIDHCDSFDLCKSSRVFRKGVTQMPEALEDVHSEVLGPFLVHSDWFMSFFFGNSAFGATAPRYVAWGPRSR